EGVGGRSGGGRHQQSVTAVGGHGPAVDLQHQLEHPQVGAALDADLVQRPAAFDHASLDDHRHVHGHAFFESVAPCDDLLEGVGEVVGLDLGQETDPAQVDAQHRDGRVAGQFGGPQEGTVTAEHQY